MLNRKTFDKRLRQDQRQYNPQQRNRIKTLNIENLTEFWKEINRLGPKRENRRLTVLLWWTVLFHTK